MKTFIVSDTHFYHDNIIELDERNYKNMDEMVDDMVSKWNNLVGEEDTVYILGDMFYRVKRPDVEYIFSKLKGNFKYIPGNHERFMKGNLDMVVKYLEVLPQYKEMKVTHNEEEYRLVLSHYPIPLYNGHFYPNNVHFYGHVHVTEEQAMTVYHQLMNFVKENKEGIHTMLNIGSMMSYMNNQPMELTKAIDLAKERTKNLYVYFNEECKRQLPTYEEFKKREDLYL